MVSDHFSVTAMVYRARFKITQSIDHSHEGLYLQCRYHSLVTFADGFTGFLIAIPFSGTMTNERFVQIFQDRIPACHLLLCSVRRLELGYINLQ